MDEYTPSPSPAGLIPEAHGGKQLKNPSGSDFPSVFCVFPVPGIASPNNLCLGSAFGGAQARLYVPYAPQTPRKCYCPSPTFPDPTPPHPLPPPRLGCASEFLAGTLVDSCCYSLFCCSVMSDSLQPHGLQDARLPCPSLSPRVCSNSCPFSWLCHTTISSSVVPFSSCPQSFSASGSFPMGQLFTSSGQSIGASAWASVFPLNIQDWFPLGLTFFKWRSWL